MEKNLADYFFACDNVCVYNSGKQIDVNLNDLKQALEELTDKSYFSPAFGVSIHKQTVEAMKKDLWIEFGYNQENSFAEMPFTKLLIQLKPDMYGFNVIRYYNNEYSGRCFYLNLNQNSTKFYNFIVDLIKTKAN